MQPKVSRIPVHICHCIMSRVCGINGWKTVLNSWFLGDFFAQPNRSQNNNDTKQRYDGSFKDFDGLRDCFFSKQVLEVLQMFQVIVLVIRLPRNVRFSITLVWISLHLFSTLVFLIFLAFHSRLSILWCLILLFRGLVRSIWLFPIKYLLLGRLLFVTILTFVYFHELYYVDFNFSILSLFN